MNILLTVFLIIFLTDTVRDLIKYGERKSSTNKTNIILDVVGLSLVIICAFLLL